MHVVIIGAQWGDEGKGKMVDYLANQADIIIRYSGGANAGHTVVNEESTYKLHLVPSGVIYDKKIVILGSGMVIDPEALFEELQTLENQKVNWHNRVYISDRAHLVLPNYKEDDKTMDKKRRNPIGTTGRGIGIAYAKKANRDGIRLCDLLDDEFASSLRDEEKDFLFPYKEHLSSMAVNIVDYMSNCKQKQILIEGAQGTLLDLDLGTYPFVSSGCSAAGGAALGSGVGPRMLNKVLGVFKAYSTRVGNGPFPTQFLEKRDGNLEHVIREKGREYGVTTGRPRRCGYLDLVALKYACQANSLDGLILTHLDVYDAMDQITLCTAYEIDGIKSQVFPSSSKLLERVNPILQTFPGWQTSLTSIKDYDNLPKEAKQYIEFIEEYTETSIDIISVGYQRTQTIIRRNPWIKY